MDKSKIKIIAKKSIEALKIRPFTNYSLPKLLRMKTFLLVCKYDLIVSNMKNIYDFSTKVLSKNLVNKMIKYMYCDLLTGGANFNELEHCVKNLEKQNTISIIDYCREFLTKDDEKHVDYIVETYIKTIHLAVSNNNKNFIALKLSSLCDIEILKAYNSIQLILVEVEENLRNNNNISLDKLNTNLDKTKNKLNNISFFGLTEETLNYLKEKYSSPLNLNLIDILNNLETRDVVNLINIFGVTEEVINYGRKFHERTNKIISYAEEHKCSVMIDAEQSYIQSFIDSAAKYYTFHHNKTYCTILQTVQCYLKDSQVRASDFIHFIRKFDLKLGIKVVRGAYMTEETKLSKLRNYEYPIFDSIKLTHESYNNLIPMLLNECKHDDKIIIASHNEESISSILKYLKETNIKSIYSAQLIGISEHITILSKENNLQTCKYIPFGDIDIMIPYLIRRAEESSIISKLSVQNSLLNDEIKLRTTKPFLILMALMLLHIYFKNNLES